MNIVHIYLTIVILLDIVIHSYSLFIIISISISAIDTLILLSCLITITAFYISSEVLLCAIHQRSFGSLPILSMSTTHDFGSITLAILMFDHQELDWFVIVNLIWEPFSSKFIVKISLFSLRFIWSFW